MARTWRLLYTIMCHFLGKGSLLSHCSVVEGVVGYYLNWVLFYIELFCLFLAPSVISTAVVTVCFLISLLFSVKIVLIS